MTRRPPHNPRPLRRRTGFTLVELLVAVSLAALMIVLISTIFNTTQAAVSQGISLSDVIANARGIGDQLEDDFENMLGPQDNDAAGLTAAMAAGAGVQFPEASGGVLVIINHQIGDWNTKNGLLDGDTDGNRQIDFDETAGAEGVEVALPGQGRKIIRLVRSDQLMFIRRRGNEFPMAPAGAGAYTPGNDSTSNPSALATFRATYPLEKATDPLAPTMRVWYGHVLPTEDDGSDPNGAGTIFDVTTDDGNLGQTGLVESPLNWTLGRQAMLFGERIRSGSTATIPNYHHDGAWYYAPTDGLTAGVAPPAGAPQNAFMGFTDYAYASLDDDRFSNAVPSGTGVGHPNGSMLGATAATIPGGATGVAVQSRLASELDDTSLSFINYKLRAVAFHTYARKRLRFAPLPPAGQYHAWRIGQMHPALAENVSDFTVEFAADLYNNTSQTIDPNAALPGSLNPDGVIDRDNSGRIVWYTGRRMANRPVLAGVIGYDDTKPLTFEVPANYPPYLDAIAGGLNFENATDAFVWRHDDETSTVTDVSGRTTTDSVAAGTTQQSWWPYLLRIRYRMHDPRGQIASGDQQHGVWFEHIVRVRRP